MYRKQTERRLIQKVATTFPLAERRLIRKEGTALPLTKRRLLHVLIHNKAMPRTTGLKASLSK